MKKNSFYKIGNFTIYHCPDLQKVGCTSNLAKRKSGYPIDTRIDVLEILENVTEREAGDREWFWADKFDYDRGRHYAYSGSTAHDGRNKALGPAGLKAVRQKQIQTLGPEGLSKASQKRADNIGPEGYKKIRQKQIQTLGHDGMAAIAVERWNKFDAAARSAIISKGWETRRRNAQKV
jgi:hypothetical protein